MTEPTKTTLLDIVAAVDALHFPIPYDSGFAIAQDGEQGQTICSEDKTFWPCDTHLALHPEKIP